MFFNSLNEFCLLAEDLVHLYLEIGFIIMETGYNEKWLLLGWHL